jgi:hypothetical protein
MNKKSAELPRCPHCGVVARQTHDRPIIWHRPNCAGMVIAPSFDPAAPGPGYPVAREMPGCDHAFCTVF